MTDPTPEYQIERLGERGHILVALARASAAWPDVLATVADSSDEAAARARLEEEFGLDSIQAQAVLDMQLRRLSVTGRAQLQGELRELRARMVELGGAGATSARVRGPAGAPPSPSPEYIVEMTAHVGAEEAGGLPPGVILSTKGTSLLFKVTLDASTAPHAVMAAREAATRFCAELVSRLSSGELVFQDESSWTSFS